MIGQPNVVSAPCRFTVLGPPGLQRGDTRLDLGAPQQQAVLMLLLANSGSSVRIGELVDGLWGERAPGSGGAVIRTYISRIRRLLAEHGLGSAISSRSGGYTLDPSLFALDATEFADLLETARQERASGHIPAAAKRLEEALDLWRGTALAGVPGEAAERERFRLERLKLIATQELLQLRLELGKHAEVVAEVPLLIEQNRLDEPLYEIYLLGLYRSGRRAEALETYRMVYDLLGKELGVSPGPRLREIHDRILRADTDHDESAPAPWAETPAAHSPEQPAPPEPARTEPERPGWRFVGRGTERAAFQDLLKKSHGERPGLLFVRGPAGIGKSTLLRKFAEDAAATGRRVRHLHGPATAEAREQLERSAEELSGVSGAVLLIDSFEELGDLEPWLRGEYLRRLPGDAIVVVAGRTGPSAAWLTDPAWSGAIVIRHLEALTATESAALVEARGVDPGLRRSIVDFAAGNPFALSLAAEVGRSMSTTGEPSRRDAVRYVVDNVLALLAGSVPTETHRWALRVCAHARHTTEDLLRAVVPGGRAAELFDWLRAQPYVETAAHGLEVNGVLREALDHDLRWRDPVGYARMHRRIRHYVMDQLLRDARDPHACVAVMRTISHLRRRGGVVRRYVSGVGEEDLRLSGATRADHDELVTMASKTHGEFTAASVRFWLGRQPGAFSVLRCRRSNRLRAFLSWLTLRTPDREELEADPVMRDIWRDVRRMTAVPPGAHIGIARHLICPAHEAEPSPITDVFQARMMRSWLHGPGLAASYLVVEDRQLWRPLMEYLDQYELECVRADHPYAIFGHDWLADPPEEWRDHHLDEELWAERHPNLFLRQDVSGVDG
ncbi:MULTISPECIES: BTAD domain-containing putative transcriptional regulator [Streptosporangium]|uniref:DNA-binding SARP family transcriptional activator n=1 Tax=Streptosporangium brasiliense TaxID=47480 RepID=A0ABT9R164_9ACTN|nr:BTAD domain-containing putative transcriptional regulator [Streptosporangium brasiliense]MDP9862549.1 DNA-binding SARP family transcriptional activator [Streptosporangium brasiliense]